MDGTLGTWRRLKDLEFKVILGYLMRSRLVVDGCGGARSGVVEEEGEKAPASRGAHGDLFMIPLTNIPLRSRAPWFVRLPKLCPTLLTELSFIQPLNKNSNK